MNMLSSQADELRKMADKLGVNGVCTDDLSELCVMLREAADTIESMRDRLQAATLGSDNAFTREEVESAFVRGYSLGSLPVGSDPQWDENRQTVDEHMAELGWVRAATLGGGECEVVRGKNGPECSKCGKELPEDPYSDYEGNFCPTCGAWIRKEEDE